MFSDSSIWQCFADTAIRILTHPCPIWEEYVLLPISKFYSFYTTLLYSLNCPIWEYTFFFTICKDTLNCTIREYDLLCSIWEMFFYLLIGKFENLQSVRECSLGSLRFSKVVNNFITWERLFDILIVKIDQGITVGPWFSAHPIAKDHLFPATLENSLYLAIIPCNLVYECLICSSLCMILIRKPHCKIILLLHLLILLILIFFLFITLLKYHIILLISYLLVCLICNGILTQTTIRMLLLFTHNLFRIWLYVIFNFLRTEVSVSILGLSLSPILDALGGILLVVSHFDSKLFHLLKIFLQFVSFFRYLIKLGSHPIHGKFVFLFILFCSALELGHLFFKLFNLFSVLFVWVINQLKIPLSLFEYFLVFLYL